MASTLCTRASSLVSSPAIRRRLPLVGAFCMLSLGLTNLCPTLSSSLKTGSAPSLPFFGSKFSNQARAKSSNTIKMEGNRNTVPSILLINMRLKPVVEGCGKKLAESIVKAKLAACVNRVPGIVQTDAEDFFLRLAIPFGTSAGACQGQIMNHVVPDVIALPITVADQPYLEWLKMQYKDVPRM
ncbi:hypothetical protein CUMW_060090 [Citrus unshiu]|uniref:Uncharacterized protein n=1 Tax=Citrus unshiu TaxID=55188 RepID=A0A2H5NMW8_CITUN|nr:hypothetical protein CUMW_060090 [Citrus unshiu]